MCSAEAVAATSEVLLLDAVYEIVEGLDLLRLVGDLGFQAWGIVFDEVRCCQFWKVVENLDEGSWYWWLWYYCLNYATGWLSCFVDVMVPLSSEMISSITVVDEHV